MVCQNGRYFFGLISWSNTCKFHYFIGPFRKFDGLKNPLYAKDFHHKQAQKCMRMGITIYKFFKYTISFAPRCI